MQQKEAVISGFSSHYFKLPEYQSWEAEVWNLFMQTFWINKFNNIQLSVNVSALLNICTATHRVGLFCTRNFAFSLGKQTSKEGLLMNHLLGSFSIRKCHILRWWVMTNSAGRYGLEWNGHSAVQRSHTSSPLWFITWKYTPKFFLEFLTNLHFTRRCPTEFEKSRMVD